MAEGSGPRHPRDPTSGPPGLTVVQLAGLGGMGELEVVEVGVLLDWLKISSSMWLWLGGEVATSACAVGAGRRVSGRPAPWAPPPPQACTALTNVLEVQVVVEELILLEVGVLGRVHIVLDVVLDLADGVHQDGVVVQHAQDGLQHPHVVAMLLDVPLQALDPVLLLLASPGPGSGAAGPGGPPPPQSPASVPGPASGPPEPTGAARASQPEITGNGRESQGSPQLLATGPIPPTRPPASQQQPSPEPAHQP